MSNSHRAVPLHCLIRNLRRFCGRCYPAFGPSATPEIRFAKEPGSTFSPDLDAQPWFAAIFRNWLLHFGSLNSFHSLPMHLAEPVRRPLPGRRIPAQPEVRAPAAAGSSSGPPRSCARRRPARAASPRTPAPGTTSTLSAPSRPPPPPARAARRRRRAGRWWRWCRWTTPSRRWPRET